MEHDVLINSLKRLLIGMSDQAIRAGNPFTYDGGVLHADEVADLTLPSVVCIAQELSDRLGLDGFGYRFALVGSNAAGFPLTMERVIEDAAAGRKRFFEIAPFVVEVFEGEVMDCRHDLAKLFESAARIVRADFSLTRDTNYGQLVA